MKIKIGKYVSWLGPYQMVDAVFFWLDDRISSFDDTRPIYNLRSWVSDRICGGGNNWLIQFCQWVHDHQHREVKIKIDSYDVWSANHTIALIVLPILKQLKTDKQGSPTVDLGDVPESLWPEVQAGPSNNYTDDKVHERWAWVLDELIWTFEQIVNEDSESQFYDHSEARDPDDDLMTQVGKLKVDRDGLEAHQERKTNGLRLFGKYYEGLWD